MNKKNNISNKLRVQVVSDLHTEFAHEDKYLYDLATDADVLVIAGDLTIDRFLRYDLDILCELYPHVLYVVGNHEYYSSTWEKVHGILDKFQKKNKNFHWLNNNIVEIDGQRFLGGTLWFEENYLSTDVYLQRQLNDFKMISDFVPRVFQEHDKTVRFLQKNVKERDVVVTHHCPHNNSIHNKFKDNLLNVFFTTHLEHIMLQCKPKMWLHAHTHSSFDYVVDKTRVICNPCGYIGHEVNKDFKRELIIEI